MCEQTPVKQLVSNLAGRGGGLRLLRHVGPLLPVARGAGPFRIRLVGAGRGGAGFTDVALVAVGGEQQPELLSRSQKELLPALREL